MMRARPAFAAWFVALLSASVASAEPMDPALARFVVDPSCRDELGRFVPPTPCRPDSRQFKRLVNQLGFALAPSAMHSARTTGISGIHVTLEGAYTTISSDASYWKDGTQGPREASDGAAPTRHDDPSSLLQLYSLKLRKGFGFGLELAGSVGFMPNTSIISGGADVRVALLEGFRRGLLGIFPDVAVGGGVRTITGTADLQLTVGGIDAQISKPLTLEGSGVLTPWLGYQHIWIFGDSGNIDLTPATDAHGYCGYAGNNVPGNRDPDKDEYDGQPICTSPDPNAHVDFNNNVVFDEARLKRHRLLVGVNYRYELVTAGAQLITDLVSPAAAQTSEEDESILEGEDRQWTFVLELGAAF